MSGRARRRCARLSPYGAALGTGVGRAGKMPTFFPVIEDLLAAMPGARSSGALGEWPERLGAEGVASDFPGARSPGTSASRGDDAKGRARGRHEGGAGDPPRSTGGRPGGADHRAPRAWAQRGARQGRCGIAELQRHRPLPGEPRLGAHPAAVHARHGRLRRGGPGGRGGRGVVGQAGGRDHQERARRHRRVRDRGRHLGLRRSARIRRCRGHRVPAHLPDLAPRAVQEGTTPGR